MLSVTLERQPGKHLGIRISGSCPEPGIFIVEILDDSITALDGEFNKKIYIFIQVKKNISHDAMIVLFRPHPPVRPAAEH